MKAIKAKRMRDLAMSAQTKDMFRTSRVLLLSMKDYKGEYLIADNIPFATVMMNLPERTGVASIVNQVTQLTQNYNYSPHLPFWLRLIKINGFLAPIGVWFGGGGSSWLFRLKHPTAQNGGQPRRREEDGL